MLTSTNTLRRPLGLAAFTILLTTALSAVAVLKVNVTSPTGEALPNASVSLLSETGQVEKGVRGADGLYVFADPASGVQTLQVADASQGATETRPVDVSGKAQALDVALSRPKVPQLEYPELGRYGFGVTAGYIGWAGDSALDTGYEFSAEGRLALFGVLLNNALNWPQRDNLYLFAALSYATYDPDFYSSADAISLTTGLGWYYWCTNFSPFSNNAKYRFGLNGRLYGGYTRAKIEWDRQYYDVLVPVWNGSEWRDEVQRESSGSGGSESDSGIFLGGSFGPRLRNVNAHWDLGVDLGVRGYVSELDFGNSHYDGLFAYMVLMSYFYAF
ncbi:MAG: carboxypeptidase regulatory-like domain-containing protein [Verrucomicrobia bacterium]|jgi:hypothetical protein|nr:carboxypeptidase regulatory-like domain-containing protein [Verrucomicrobiota bacterium]MBT7067232.1 carboxypeptidase regulatory-like domain-containing protein [Verrucomicrobiota bacterium]MBT7699013.1 carboxypeptidase regulatory-like domain-containing protein [Verrucomicrobiota bacterium]